MVPVRNALELFTQHKSRRENVTLVYFYGRSFSYGEMDTKSDGLASYMQKQGILKEDRVAICLQNIPQYIIIILAAWKVGAIVVNISPMSKEKEMEYILNDSGASMLFTLRGELLNISNNVWPQLSQLRKVVYVNPVEYLPQDAVQQYPELSQFIAKEKQQQSPSNLFGSVFSFEEVAKCQTVENLQYAEMKPSDIAFLTYTSGTTGPSKGAMNTHGNVVFNSYTFWKWAKLSPSDVILGVAPLFHITGLIAHTTLSFIGPIPLVLTWQFHPSLVGRLIENYKCTFTVAASTVFTALLHDSFSKNANLSSLQKCFSGGAPISPTLIEAVEKTYGILLHSAYGMTETTSPTHLTPLGIRTPIHPTYNAASVGVPIYDTTCKIVDENHNELPPGEIGEISLKGPSVIPGYWQKAEETRKAFDLDGTIYSGDVGLVDEKGWFFLVDRKKDLIIASGFKIWPREVEDEIYKHPKVKEVAVIGVPDSYRGETVRAYVSVKEGEKVTPEEIIEFCKSRMAAYKYPRQVEILKEIPKNLAGKVLRRELRAKL